MSIQTDLQDRFDLIYTQGHFNAEEKTETHVATYHAGTQVEVNRPFSECDTIVTVAIHPYDYAVSASAVFAALAGFEAESEKDAIVAVLIANGTRLDGTQPPPGE